MVAIIRGREETARVKVRQEGTTVLIINKEGKFLELPWDAALAVAKALRIQAKRAEEFAKRCQIIMDQAILMRKGIPFGLTSNPAMQQEAGKEAAHNRQLRLYMPGGVKSQECLGTPAVLQHSPPKAEEIKDG